jgi:5-methylcytosine-specific restriction endonuclease McrA
MSKGGARPGSGRKKGSIPWNKGVPMSIESKLKVSQSKKGTLAWNKGLKQPEVGERMKGNTNGQGNKGRKMSKEWIKKLSLAKKGKPSGRKGMKFNPEWIEKIAASKRGKTHSAELRESNRQGQYRRYLKINPDYVVATRNKRIATNGGFHSEAEWISLKTKYNFTCPSCKRKEPEIKLTRDHVLPLLLGGKNDITNIQPLCLKCNTKKHTQTIRY